jgi:hypothetical protein
MSGFAPGADGVGRLIETDLIVVAALPATPRVAQFHPSFATSAPPSLRLGGALGLTRSSGQVGCVMAPLDR